MDYKIVFEITNNSIGELSFILPGIIFVLIGAGLIKFRNKLAQDKPRVFVNFFTFLFFGFAVFWTISAGTNIWIQHSSLYDNYKKGNYKVVEGLVENFDPMPHSGHKLESFTVNGVKFEYSDYMVTSGFNNTASHGGPIKEGLQVKISYIGNNILKLEIKQDTNKSLVKTHNKY